LQNAKNLSELTVSYIIEISRDYPVTGVYLYFAS